MYRAFPTAADPADRAVGPLSPLPCQAWHGYGVCSAHHGEVRGCRRDCERTPSGVAAAAPPAGAAVPKDDLSIIESISEDDKTCGHTAWTALVNHYKDDGIYWCTELLQDLDTPQADGESGIQYLNRLVRLQRPLARIGDVVHDRRIIMYLVKGMRSDYFRNREHVVTRRSCRPHKGGGCGA
jgi:hypothetical protein